MATKFRVKMTAIITLLMVILTAGAASAQDATAEATPEATPFADYAVRTYEIHVPDSYDEATPVPLLLVLHGASGTGARSEEWLGFDELADSEGFIVVYPDGLFNNWDFGAGMQTPYGAYIRVDDVGYLTWLVDQLAGQYSIDLARVFVVGNSNGALMAYRLACEAPETFKAVAGVAAGVFVQAVQNCQDHPIPVLMVQGTDDTVLPWDGMLLNGQYVGFSAADSMAFWAKLDGCNTAKEAVQQEALTDSAAPDSSTVTHIFLADCADGTRLDFYAVVGGGHTWPGRPFDVGIDLGAVNLDMDATQVIWEWFAGLDTAAVPEATPTE